MRSDWNPSMGKPDGLTDQQWDNLRVQIGGFFCQRCSRVLCDKQGDLCVACGELVAKERPLPYPYSCRLHGGYHVSCHCPGCIHEAGAILLKLMVSEQPSISGLSELLERAYSLISNGIKIDGKFLERVPEAMRVHSLACEKPHPHQALECCAETCWCKAAPGA